MYKWPCHLWGQNLLEQPSFLIPVLLSFQACVTVCIAIPRILTSDHGATSVADIIMLWNFTGPALSRARKWLSGWNKIGRHQPPISISILCALCSWGKRWCYCSANCNDRGEFSREWWVSVLCVINKFQYIMDSFYLVMGEICFLMIFFLLWRL